MTVSSTSRKAGPFLGNGATTSFPFTFKCFATTDVAVYHTDVTGVQTKLTTGFTVALNADQENNPGGSVTYPAAGDPMLAGEQLDLIGDQAYVQGVDISNAAIFQASVIQKALDYLVILCQQLLERANRALTFPVGDTASTALPSAADRALKGLVFDSNGDPQMSADLYDLSGALAQAQTNADTATTQAGIATAQAGTATTQAGIATTQAGIATSYAVDAQTYSNIATIASGTMGAYPNGAATVVPKGLTQASVGAITAGSGGTNGTFNLSWSSGNFTISPSGTFTVSGGAVTAVTITGPGLCLNASPSIPTPSFAASSGLTGAGVSLTIQSLVTAGQGYWVANSAGTQLDHYKNVAGTATADTSVPSISAVGELTKTTDMAASLVLDYVKNGKNLYDPTVAQTGYAVVASNGSVTSSGASPYTATGFIPVKAGGTFITNYGSASTNWAYYKKDKTFLQAGGHSITANSAETVPTGAYFVRLTFTNSTTNYNALIVATGSSLPGLNNGVILTETDSEAQIKRVARESYGAINIFNKDDLTLNVRVVYPNDSTGSTWASNYMPVQGGDYITANFNSWAQVNSVTDGVVWYDKNKNKIGSSSPTNLAANTPLAVPSGASYARISLSATTDGPFSSTPATGGIPADQMIVVQGQTLPGGYVPFGGIAAIAQYISQTNSPWIGKKFAILGDSISYRTNWMDTTATALGGSLQLWAASNGRRMKEALYQQDEVTPLTSSDFTDVDCAVISLGTNDVVGDPYLTPQGTVDDSPSLATTFAAATKYVIEQLFTWKPGMRVVITTLHYKVDSVGDPDPARENRCDLIRAIAQKYGVPVLDFQRNENLNHINEDVMLFTEVGSSPPVKVHFTPTGYAQCMIPCAMGFFRTIAPAG